MTTEIQLELDFNEQPAFEWTNSILLRENASTAMLTLAPSRNVTFHGKDGETIGELNWTNGPMTFKGDADASGQMFFDVVIKQYAKWTGTQPTEWKT
jgi:hypothetical protein